MVVGPLKMLAIERHHQQEFEDFLEIKIFVFQKLLPHVSMKKENENAQNLMTTSIYNDKEM